MAEDLVQYQIAESGPKPSGVASGTGLLLAPERVADRLRHFPEDVYDLAPESHLVRFLKVVLGEAGAGGLRKRLLLARLQQTLRGSHFFDLDRFYGALFGLQRKVAEVLDLDPYTEVATNEEWANQHAKDASYRSRIEQFARAISYGPTPTGIELVAEAVLGVDVDVYEEWVRSDNGFRTIAEVEAEYPTFADAEGLTYGEIAGHGLAELAGDERRQFTIMPKRQITLEDAYHLRRVVDKLRPADARAIIDAGGLAVHQDRVFTNLVASSEFWEIVSEVATRDLEESPYLRPSATPVEQPRPPFTAYQGEAWSYVGDMVGVIAYESSGSVAAVLPDQRVVHSDGTFIDFPPQNAVIPPRYVLAGRSVSDGVLVTHPYSAPRTKVDLISVDLAGQVTSTPDNRSLTPSIYTDRVPVEAMADAATALGNQALDFPALRYWVSPERPQGSDARETVEVRLNGERVVNYVSFEVSHFPHTAIAEVYNSQTGQWDEVFRRSVTDSVPAFLTHLYDGGHPHHGAAGHWVKCSGHIAPVVTSRLRVVQVRSNGTPPRRPVRTMLTTVANQTTDVPYSLALRSLDVGYRIRSRADVPDTDPLGETTDPLGSLVQFRLREERAIDLLEGDRWRSEPQPVNYGVVTLVGDFGAPETIDRFWLDPTHTGPHMTIYWSNDDLPVEGVNYDDLVWVPLPRDYVLQKGFVHIPPTRARFWKFEFTNLVAEPFENFLGLTRRVRLFPAGVLQSYTSRSTPTGDATPGLRAAISVNERSMYADSPLAPLVEDRHVLPDQDYRATEALFVSDPEAAQRLRQTSWAFGFTPWHVGTSAPRFSKRDRHRYDEVEVPHNTKVAFFVGLQGLRAYRVNYQASDDTEVYIERFWDGLDLQPGFTWALDSGTGLWSSDAPEES